MKVIFKKENEIEKEQAPVVGWYRKQSFGKRFSQTKISQNVPPPKNIKYNKVR